VPLVRATTNPHARPEAAQSASAASGVVAPESHQPEIEDDDGAEEGGEAEMW